MSFASVYADVGGPLQQWLESPPATKEKIWIAELFGTQPVVGCLEKMADKVYKMYFEKNLKPGKPTNCCCVQNGKCLGIF